MSKNVKLENVLASGNYIIKQYIFTWRYLSCMADELSEIVSDASFRALAAFCSPSAAMTWDL